MPAPAGHGQRAENPKTKKRLEIFVDFFQKIYYY